MFYKTLCNASEQTATNLSVNVTAQSFALDSLRCTLPPTLGIYSVTHHARQQ